MPDYYQVLGVNSDASPEDIKQSYKSKVRLYHPDKNLQNKEWAERKFNDVQTAYHTLSDETRRRAYDTYGKNYAEVVTREADNSSSVSVVFSPQVQREIFLNQGFYHVMGPVWGPHFEVSRWQEIPKNCTVTSEYTVSYSTTFGPR